MRFSWRKRSRIASLAPIALRLDAVLVWIRPEPALRIVHGRRGMDPRVGEAAKCEIFMQRNILQVVLDEDWAREVGDRALHEGAVLDMELDHVPDLLHALQRIRLDLALVVD